MAETEDMIVRISSRQHYVGAMIDLGLSYYLLLYHFDGEMSVVFTEFVFFDRWSRSRLINRRKNKELTKVLNAELGEYGPQGRREFRLRFEVDGRTRLLELFFRSATVHERASQPTVRF